MHLAQGREKKVPSEERPKTGNEQAPQNLAFGEEEIVEDQIEAKMYRHSSLKPIQSPKGGQERLAGVVHEPAHREDQEAHLEDPKVGLESALES